MTLHPPRPIHLRAGPAGAGDFYPTACGLLPVARPTTSADLAHVTCAECRSLTNRSRATETGGA